MSWPTLANALVFKLTWTGCVLGGVAGGAAPLAGLFALSWWRGALVDDLKLVPALAVAGFALDTAWDRLGIVDYVGTTFAPPWIVMLWVAVALVVNHSLAYFKDRPLQGGLLAGAVAPASYLIAARLGAAVVPAPGALVVVALAWAVVFAVIFTSLAGSGARHTSEEHS